jgi:hypothetical protein
MNVPDTAQKLEDLAADWWREAYTLHTASRAERARDEDYYDGIQWTDAEIAELMNRGQAPLVFNVIAPVVNWLTGTERRTRIDFSVVPRELDSSLSEAGVAKTNLLKYLHTTSYIKAENSRAFKDGVCSGEGWVEVCFSDFDDEEPVKVVYEDWRNIWFDYRDTTRTLTGARYLFRSKIVDVDTAVALCPNKEADIRAAATSNNTAVSGYDPAASITVPGAGINAVELNRELVRLVEGWFRIPKVSNKVDGGTFDGYYEDQIVDDLVPILEGELMHGEAELVEVRTMRVYTALFVAEEGTAVGSPALTLLKEHPSPYKHNRFPFVPFFCYRRKRDNMPYGVVRPAVGAQDDLNKRRSKAIHILSTTRVIADADALSPAGWDNIEDELPRADAVLKLDGRRNARFELHTDTVLADSHINLMDEDKAAIFLTTGVNSESLGAGSPYASNKAILTRQDQSTVVTTEVFDNYMLFLQLEGELLLSLAEQAYSDEKVVRVRSEDGRWQYLELNMEAPDGSIINDIAETRHDFMLSEVDYRDTMRQAMFEKMMEMMGQLPPDVSMAMLDLVVDMSDIPNKKTIVERIRAITGQEPPADDATPEDAAKRQQREAAKQQQAAQQEAEMQTQLRLSNAEAARKEADAKWKEVKAEHVRAQSVQTKAKVAAEMGLLPTNNNKTGDLNGG